MDSRLSQEGGPKAENHDSAAAAAYGEICPATKYPLQCDPRGAPLALGLSWCPHVTLGWPGDNKASCRYRVLRASPSGGIGQTVKQSLSSLPKPCT